MIDKYPQRAMAIINMEVYKDEYFSKHHSSEGKKKSFTIEINSGFLRDEIVFEVVKHTQGSAISKFLRFGFDAFLLKEKSTGNHIVAFRGTEGVASLDAITDIGMALGINAQKEFAQNFINSVLKDESLGVDKDKMILTGHSLGGVLATQIGLNNKIPAIAINPLGLKKKTGIGNKLSLGVSLSKEEEEWAKKNILILSYNSKKGTEILSGAATWLAGNSHIGTVKIIKGISEDWFDGHSMSAVLNAYNNKESTEITSKAGGVTGDDAEEAKKANSMLPGSVEDNMTKVNTTLEEYSKVNKTAKMKMLTGMSAEELIKKAYLSQDYMYAIKKGNTFVIEGGSFLYPIEAPSEEEVRKSARTLTEVANGNSEEIRKEEISRLVKYSDIHNTKSLKIRGLYFNNSSEGKILVSDLALAIVANKKNGRPQYETENLFEKHVNKNPTAELSMLYNYTHEELLELAYSDISFTYAIEKNNVFAIKGGRYEEYEPQNLSKDELKGKIKALLEEFNPANIKIKNGIKDDFKKEAIIQIRKRDPNNENYANQNTHNMKP